MNSSPQPEAPLELKFNGWHDQDDGRFTYKGQGRFFAAGSPESNGSKGGGGSMGGGGKTGSWQVNEKPIRRTDTTPSVRMHATPVGSSSVAPSDVSNIVKKLDQTARSHIVKAGDNLTEIAKRERITVLQLSAANSIADPDKIKIGSKLLIPSKSAYRTGWAEVDDNSYSFELDEAGRTRIVGGTLGVSPSDRSRTNQARAGQPDRKPTDDGGHFIAVRFNGPKAAYNHFAQNSNFNRSEYKSLEDKWAKAQREGHDVRVHINVIYPTGSKRPYELVVQSITGRRAYIHTFTNEAGGRHAQLPK